MRTLRLSLAGIVVLALLGGLGGAVVAQGEEEQPASIVYTREESSLIEFDSQGTTTYTPRGVRQLRGVVATAEVEQTDPRLSGTATLVYNEDQYPDWMGPKWGHYTVENAGGSWVGWMLGMEVPREEPEQFPVYIEMAAGMGGYEGLSFMCYTSFPRGPGWEGERECYVFEGPLPDLATPTGE